MVTLFSNNLFFCGSPLYFWKVEAVLDLTDSRQNSYCTYIEWQEITFNVIPMGVTSLCPAGHLTIN